MDEHLKWKETSRELLRRCRIFDLYTCRKDPPPGTGKAEAEFYLLDAPDWISVVPVVRRGREEAFVMVRQYRHGIDSVTLEFPAGLSEPDEDGEVTARRELQEETGYGADTFALAGNVAAAPAFMNNRLLTYVAQDVAEVSKQELDAHEILEVLEVPSGELSERIGTGELINSVTILSYWQYLRFRGADRIRTGA